MRRPTKFISLHNHTSLGSPYDGLGLPPEHFEFAEKNGLLGHAITEHGNFNSYPLAQLFIEDWKKKGKTFRYFPGIEAYFHPSLDQWALDKVAAEVAATDAKEAKKLKKKQEVETVITEVKGDNDDTSGIETSNALAVENEDESKSTKGYNPVNRRHHLVLLPKNETGLQQLYHLTSLSYIKGFYRFPRIDLKMMKEILVGGHVVAQSACVAGLPAFNIFRKLEHVKFENLVPTLLDDPNVMNLCVNAVGNAYDMMVDVFGKENYFLELQFNKLPAQDTVNRAMIEFARRNGLTDRLTAAGDAHYYNPDVWREREVYKKLAYLNYTQFNPDLLPKSKDDLKCELYPKNADQMWDEYLAAKDRWGFYDDKHDEVVCNAIENSHHVAFDVISEIKPDRSIKLPRSLIPEGRSADSQLARLAVEGLKKRGLAHKPEYIARLKEELEVIKTVKMSEYFVTLARILELARAVVLLGPGRGSGAGSLVNYVLYCTDLDPIRWDIPFSRFMSKYRCLTPETLVLKSDMTECEIQDLQIGDYVLDGSKQPSKIVDRYESFVEEIVQVVIEGQIFECSRDHLWPVIRNNTKMLLRADELLAGDEIENF